MNCIESVKKKEPNITRNKKEEKKGPTDLMVGTMSIDVLVMFSNIANLVEIHSVFTLEKVLYIEEKMK